MGPSRHLHDRIDDSVRGSSNHRCDRKLGGESTVVFNPHNYAVRIVRKSGWRRRGDMYRSSGLLASSVDLVKAYGGSSGSR